MASRRYGGLEDTHIPCEELDAACCDLTPSRTGRTVSQPAESTGILDHLSMDIMDFDFCSDPNLTTGWQPFRDDAISALSSRPEAAHLSPDLHNSITEGSNNGLEPDWLQFCTDLCSSSTAIPISDHASTTSQDNIFTAGPWLSTRDLPSGSRSSDGVAESIQYTSGPITNGSTYHSCSIDQLFPWPEFQNLLGEPLNPRNAVHSFETGTAAAAEATDISNNDPAVLAFFHHALELQGRSDWLCVVTPVLDSKWAPCMERLSRVVGLAHETIMTPKGPRSLLAKCSIGHGTVSSSIRTLRENGCISPRVLCLRIKTDKTERARWISYEPYCEIQPPAEIEGAAHTHSISLLRKLSAADEVLKYILAIVDAKTCFLRQTKCTLKVALDHEGLKAITAKPRARLVRGQHRALLSQAIEATSMEDLNDMHAKIKSHIDHISAVRKRIWRTLQQDPPSEVSPEQVISYLRACKLPVPRLILEGTNPGDFYASFNNAASAASVFYALHTNVAKASDLQMVSDYLHFENPTQLLQVEHELGILAKRDFDDFTAATVLSEESKIGASGTQETVPATTCNDASMGYIEGDLAAEILQTAASEKVDTPMEQAVVEQQSPCPSSKWKCPYPGCIELFTTNNDRKQHEQVHQKKREHSCQHCEKAFPYPKDLKRHMNAVHKKVQ